MLPELAAANAAYAKIKTFVIKGKEITDVLSQLKNLVTAKKRITGVGQLQEERSVLESDG